MFLPLRFDIGETHIFGSANRETSNILEMIANRRGIIRGIFSRRLPLVRHFANCKKSTAAASIVGLHHSGDSFFPNESATEFRADPARFQVTPRLRACTRVITSVFRKSIRKTIQRDTALILGGIKGMRTRET